jgi:hypothetical protein
MEPNLYDRAETLSRMSFEPAGVNASLLGEKRAV